jgi:sec-independent protein translocase protein TatB
VPDIGLGELIVIAVLALLVFGDRLPKVAADAARTLRQVRQMATAARKDLADAAGLAKDTELGSAMRDLRDLDPRRVLEPLDDAGVSGSGAGSTGKPRGSAAGAAASAAASSGGSDGSTAVTPEATDTSGRPAVDPDWT